MSEPAGPLDVAREGHVGCVTALVVSGRTLISGGGDRTVRAWDIEKRTPLGKVGDHGGAIAALGVDEPSGKETETSRGAAAAATWIVRGDKARRRRGRDVDIPRRRVVATQILRGLSKKDGAGGPTPQESSTPVGEDVDSPRRQGAAPPRPRRG